MTPFNQNEFWDAKSECPKLAVKETNEFEMIAPDKIEVWLSGFLISFVFLLI